MPRGARRTQPARRTPHTCAKADVAAVSLMHLARLARRLRRSGSQYPRHSHLHATLGVVSARTAENDRAAQRGSGGGPPHLSVCRRSTLDEAAHAPCELQHGLPPARLRQRHLMRLRRRYLSRTRSDQARGGLGLLLVWLVHHACCCRRQPTSAAERRAGRRRRCEARSPHDVAQARWDRGARLYPAGRPEKHAACHLCFQRPGLWEAAAAVSSRR